MPEPPAASNSGKARVAQRLTTEVHWNLNSIRSSSGGFESFSAYSAMRVKLRRRVARISSIPARASARASVASGLKTVLAPVTDTRLEP